MPLIELKCEALDQSAIKYLEKIEDPVQQYAMRILLKTKCAPDIAAAATIQQHRIHDPEGKLVQAITAFIDSGLEVMGVKDNDIEFFEEREQRNENRE